MICSRQAIRSPLPRMAAAALNLPAASPSGTAVMPQPFTISGRAAATASALVGGKAHRLHAGHGKKPAHGPLFAAAPSLAPRKSSTRGALADVARRIASTMAVERTTSANSRECPAPFRRQAAASHREDRYRRREAHPHARWLPLACPAIMPLGIAAASPPAPSMAWKVTSGGGEILGPLFDKGGTGSRIKARRQSGFAIIITCASRAVRRAVSLSPVSRSWPKPVIISTPPMAPPRSAVVVRTYSPRHREPTSSAARHGRR